MTFNKQLQNYKNEIEQLAEKYPPPKEKIKPHIFWCGVLKIFENMPTKNPS